MQKDPQTTIIIKELIQVLQESVKILKLGNEEIRTNLDTIEEREVFRLPKPVSIENLQ
jgi:hypothetical protein